VSTKEESLEFTRRTFLVGALASVTAPALFSCTVLRPETSAKPMTLKEMERIMPDFHCLDLSKNSRSEKTAEAVSLSEDLKKFLSGYQSGPQQILGMPFLVASGADGPGIRLPPGKNSCITFPIEGRARWLMIIHDADVGMESKTAARYVLHRKDADAIEKTVRLGLELPIHSLWGSNLGTFDTTMPTLAAPTDSWSEVQMGLTVFPGEPSPYRIFVWENPEPDVTIESLECINLGEAAIVISAVTLCNEPEHPVRVIPRTTLAIDLSGIENIKVEDVIVEIDRGMVVRVEPLLPLGEDFFSSPRKGWGIDPVEKKDSFRAEVYGPAGGKVTVKASSGEQGTIRFGEALEPGVHELAEGKIRVEMLHPHKTWIHAKVVDEETGQAVAARVHFRGERGEYIPPAGHHRDVNNKFLELIGADVHLGGTNYAYVDGTFQIDMPVGKVHVEAVRGLEYTPLRTTLDIQPGQKELTIPIKRLVDMNKKGYYSGDTHVHFVTTQGGLLEAAGEDLDIMNLLISQWGKLYTSFEQFTGGPSVISTDETIIYVNQENRQHTLGHINLLGLKEPVFPICTGEAGEAWVGDAVEASVADWSRETHRQGGLVVQPHFGNCYGEYICGTMQGYIDATELAAMGFFGEQFYRRTCENWYSILNCGYKMPVVGGTDKMSNGTCVGGCRSYVYTGTDRKLNYQEWCDGIRRGNTFTTTGPMIFFTVDGLPIGSTLRMGNTGGTVAVEASAIGYFPLDRIELIQNGRVIAEQEAEKNACDVTLSTTVSVKDSGWLAARCWGRSDVPGPRGLTAAHTSPIYIEVGDRKIFHPADAQYLIEVLDDMMAWAEEIGVFRDPKKRVDVLNLFAQSKTVLHQRLHDADAPTHGNGKHSHGCHFHS